MQNRIFTIRSIQMMTDKDLAELYGVESKRLKEQWQEVCENQLSLVSMGLTQFMWRVPGG